MDSKHFMMLSELFDQFRMQALMLLKDAEECGFLDDLTSCYNRKAYNIRKEQLQSLPNVGVIFVDVNGLKSVNDKQGHKVGDILLRDLGKMLKAYYGGNDVFRVGGDEFIILKPNTKLKIIAAINDEFITTINSTHKTNVAIGFAMTTEHINLDEAVRKAERLMYKDKNNYYNNLAL